MMIISRLDIRTFRGIQELQLDDYANEYLSKQHSLCKSIYRSLHLLRCLLQTHPKLKNTKIRYSKTDYIEL